jgi:hypothetical protein
VAIRGRQQDSWRPPDTWECPAEAAKSPTTPLEAPLRLSKNKKTSLQPSELTHLRKNLRRMEAASPKIVIERLKEEWIEIADASVYRELELEKQLWMLTTLRILEKKHSISKHSTELVVINKSSTSPAKILSLFENHGKALRYVFILWELAKYGQHQHLSYQPTRQHLRQSTTYHPTHSPQILTPTSTLSRPHLHQPPSPTPPTSSHPSTPSTFRPYSQLPPSQQSSKTAIAASPPPAPYT